MIKKLNNLSFVFKKKNIFKITSYTLIFFFITLNVYFAIPKLFNYSDKLIIENFKNNNIDIENISKIKYIIFPSPRLRISANNLILKTGILKIEKSEIDIILNKKNILNYKKLNHNKLLITGGIFKVDIKKLHHLFNFIKTNKTKIMFKKSNFIMIQNNKKLFEINNNIIEINPTKNKNRLTINGIFLNHKIFFHLEINKDQKNNISLKIPALDIMSDVSFENKGNINISQGLINLEVFNNFFQLDFTQDENIKINKGFVRNNLINSSLDGYISFKPNFLLNINFQPRIFDIKKLFFIFEKKYFPTDIDRSNLIKKINGSFNFKSFFEGNVTFKNGNILFKDFIVGKKKDIFFDATIFEFGKNKKIHFSLIKKVKYKKSDYNEIKISGFLIPLKSKVVFEKLSYNNKNYSGEQIKNYQEKFENEIVLDSISNIFDELKLNRYFKKYF